MQAYKNAQTQRPIQKVKWQTQWKTKLIGHGPIAYILKLLAIPSVWDGTTLNSEYKGI